MAGVSAQSPNLTQEPPSEPPSKRRRVALACQHCRERKVRCDGARPICGACRRREATTDQPCEYLVIAETAKYQTERAYIDSLRAHVADLQEGASREPLESPPRQTVASVPGQGFSVQHTLPAGNTVPISLGAMGAALPSTPEEADYDQYYGQSSLVSLVHQYAHKSPSHQSVQSQTGSSIPSLLPASSTPWAGPSTSLTNITAMLSDDFSLPPRRLADWLLDVYFANNHIFYPWVHKDTFMTAYENIWTNQSNNPARVLPDVGLGSQSCPPRLFHCALNAMFAIACEFSNMDPCYKRNSSMMFYERMKSSMNIDILDSGSLAHVQALLLIAIYLQCTPFPKRCWNVIGMAHRMAVGLGLQKRHQFSNLSVLEKEIRWRAWCACVQMDIIVSMTMGRPPMTLNSSYIPLPSPVDDKYLASGNEGAQQPIGTISTNQFLHQNMRLIGILWKILLRIYRNDDEGPTEESTSVPEGFKAVMDLDRLLEEFKASLPPVFAWGSSNLRNADRTFRRQSNVLNARYLHLKLLLYRPTFSAYCSGISSGFNQTQPDSWSTMYQQNAALKCVRAACDLIHSLSDATTEDATGAWWYGIFYLISAGIVLLLAESSGASFEGIPVDQQEGAWNECLDTMNRMVSVHPSARDYCIALHNIRLNCLSQKKNGTDQTRSRQTPIVASSNDETDECQANAMQADEAEHNVPSPIFKNWDAELGDIMLPAQFLQELDEGLLLPNLF